jgi:hypothetical protein
VSSEEWSGGLSANTLDEEEGRAGRECAGRANGKETRRWGGEVKEEHDGTERGEQAYTEAETDRGEKRWWREEMVARRDEV